MWTEIAEALVKVFVAIAVVMLPPLIAQGFVWIRAKANETKLGSQSKIDDLFFDELQGAVNGLMSTAQSWKVASGGKLTDAQKKQLNDAAIAEAVKNLKQHGADFASRLPLQAAEDWIRWHVDQTKPVPPA